MYGTTPRWIGAVGAFLVLLLSAVTCCGRRVEEGLTVNPAGD
ncbi:hypothetical protein N8I84_40285 [Streptomyces cynarae]|uniref:Uncharacterized protein n=1 Tax=Streptomyces cynarae TaxID=2981134 RepID=A0ABY6EBY5_9ACTN|nr:hypothetical protein [Streptomyces cynarae]UXY24226.1 hypothetical protein N8I84_40285 [Streptomyces cynarae]